MESFNKKNSFTDVINKFITEMTSLKKSLPLQNEILAAKIISDIKKKNKFFEKYGINDINDGNVFASIPMELRPKIRDIFKNIENSIFAVEKNSLNSIVSFISTYDAFMGDLIRQIYYERPEVLNTSEKQYKVSEILSYKDFDELKDVIIEKEVETLLRQSHIDQFKWLENKLSISCIRNFDIFSHFVEITERRNLFVHCNGIVSHSYIEKCRDSKVENIENIECGQKLFSDNEYFNNSFSVILRTGIMLGYTLWSKIKPDDSNLINELSNVCYELIREEQYDIALYMLKFATETNSFKKHFNNEILYVFTINKALCYYLKGDKDKCKDIINTLDMSGAADLYKLAVSVLLEEYVTAATLMKKIELEDIDTKVIFIEWPLFSEFRRQDIFKQIFAEKFGEEYVEFEPINSDLTEILKAAEDIIKAKRHNDTSINGADHSKEINGFII